MKRRVRTLGNKKYGGGRIYKLFMNLWNESGYNKKYNQDDYFKNLDQGDSLKTYIKTDLNSDNNLTPENDTDPSKPQIFKVKINSLIPKLNDENCV